MNGFDVYKIYLAIKLHFTSKNQSYDYHKHNGRTTARMDTFTKRRDRYFFHKLSKSYNDKSIVNYFLSNFVSNTIISTYWKIEEQLKFWNEEVVWDFFDEKVEKININDLNRVTDNSELSKEIQEKITTLYEKEVPFAAIWDVVTEWLRSKIIKTHFSLDDSINTLEKTIKVSQKVCNSQSTWDWLCK